MRQQIERLAVGTVAAALALLVLALPAMAKPARGGGGTPAPTGYDIGYPQCNNPVPASPAFGIVGVNYGVLYSANPCLGTGDGPSELAWAEAATNHAPAFYANTGNPGSLVSSHWPVNSQTPQQTLPQLCTLDDRESKGCSFDYGWNAAKDSFNNAVTAEMQIHVAGFDATAAAVAAPWWLDVETANSWEALESQYGRTAAALDNDTQALLGAVAALTDSGVKMIGIYSTAYQWNQITGGTGGQFAANPSWVAGSTSAAAAQRLCGTTGFTGGLVKMAQYPSAGFDADIACP